MSAAIDEAAHSRNARFEAFAAEIGHSFDGEIRVGGHYVGAVEHDGVIYISGQIPRLGTSIAVTGRVGADATLDDARRAARICVMRALALLRQAPGGLARVRRILRMTVYVQSAADFTQQSEVADAASDVLHALFADAGTHTRTSIGVLQLPKNASVELDMLVAVEPLPSAPGRHLPSDQPP